MLQKAVEGGLESETYTHLLHQVCAELQSSLSLHEAVSLPQGSEDREAFHLELRSFLAELRCPHVALTKDVHFLSSYQKRLLVVDYLVSELLACRLTLLRQSQEQAMDTTDYKVCGWTFVCLFVYVLIQLLACGGVLHEARAGISVGHSTCVVKV